MLAPGTRIGPYEVTDQIGVGGMGEVYRATDTNLGRQVAIKVLPDAVAMDTERLARFDREARTLAALNHSNIATIYGVERSGGTTALVMELVEGPTLADRIIERPIPIDEAIVIARQVAEALEAAHEQGIVHRDLKPANIKVRPDGTVKVLDFGLAKALESSTVPRIDVTHSPTLSLAATQAGVLFGTAAYMSPEQAAGKPVDRRADIWSFGVVLWEMMTGKPLFGGGDSIALILADVLRAPIDFERIPPGHLRDLLVRCLDRDVKTRLRDIGEARVALARPDRASSLVPATDSRGPSSLLTRHARGSAIAWAAAAVFATAAVLALWAPWRITPERPLVRLDVDLGADVALPSETFNQNVVLSPDGTRLAYVSRGSSGQTRLYVRRFDQDTAMELAGTEGAVSATFSPDSNSLAFLRANSVYRISVQGGAAQRLSEGDVSNNSLAWTENGSILLAGIGAGLRRIPAGGGEQVRLTDLAEGEAIHAQPFPLAGGKTVLFAAGTQLQNSRIEVISTSGGPRKVVVQDGTAPHYLNGGYLAYLSQGTLFAIRFDPETLETRGDPVPIVTDVKLTYSGLATVGTFSISNDGTLVYRRASSPLGLPGPAWRRSTITWIEAAGKHSPLLTKAGAYGDPRVSPDGSQLSLTVIDTPTPYVATYDPRRDTLTRMSFEGVNVDAVWSPDGRYLVFLTLGGGGVDGALTWTPIGGGQPRTLVKDGARALGSFSPDGKWLAYVTRGSVKGRPRTTQIVTATVTEENGQLKSGDPQSFSPSQFSEREPEFSSDGKWIAFVTDRSGRDEIAVRSFPISSSGPSAEAVVSNNGGINPRWSRNGRELMYLEGDRIMRVTFTVNGGAFVADKPQVFLEKAAHQWDLAPDGRLAMIEPVETQPGAVPAAEHHVVLLEHFIDEVKRRVK